MIIIIAPGHAARAQRGEVAALEVIIPYLCIFLALVLVVIPVIWILMLAGVLRADIPLALFSLTAFSVVVHTLGKLAPRLPYPMPSAGWRHGT